MLLLLISGIASATPVPSNAPVPPNQDPDLTQKLRQIHQKVVSKGLASLTDDGQIVISATASQIGVHPDLFDKYLESLENINSSIRIGGVSFDDQFNLVVGSTMEVVQDVYQKSLQRRATEEQHVVPFNDPGAPVLQAYAIANSNYYTLVNYYNSIATGIWGDPLAAYSATLGMWIAKVAPGGDWDYKVVPGYAPYNREWEARTRTITKIATTEWFGNYNYGYTGKFLFPLSILKTGGDWVSIITGGAPDDFEDTAAITEGYNDNLH